MTTKELENGKKVFRMINIAFKVVMTFELLTNIIEAWYAISYRADVCFGDVCDYRKANGDVNGCIGEDNVTYLKEV